MAPAIWGIRLTRYVGMHTDQRTTCTLLFQQCTLACALIAILVAPASATDQERPNQRSGPMLQAPQWIWVEADDEELETIVFHKQIDVPARAQQIQLRIANEFCELRLSVGGQQLIVLEDFTQPLTSDATRYFRPGENTVTVQAIPAAGPSALALSIDVVDENDQISRTVSDDSWPAEIRSGSTSQSRPVQTAGRVSSEMWAVNARPAKIGLFHDYTQWERALGEEAGPESGRFWTVEGFQVERVRAARPDEGSWVAMAFDEQGRITIAREDRGLLRLTLGSDGRSIVGVEVIDTELQECRGLLYDNGALYVNANNSKGFYRLRDTTGDSRFDERQLVRQFSGDVGHGRNQIAAGPGGTIYGIYGDAVESPAKMFDLTSPLRKARRGETTMEGFLTGFDPQTNSWQLVCSGLRNPFGVAFNRDGEAFTYDADAEYDMGTPWYRPTRIVHLRSGADYGWRGEHRYSWPPYDPDRPDVALPLLDIGKGSPTAVRFGYESRFPSRYREALFVLDWAYGRILAVHLRPRGASYVAQAETFLEGQPLNVTGLEFGPDGAMYFVTGGRETKSALYRLSYIGEPQPTSTASTHERSRTLHARRAANVRRELETFHGSQDSNVVDAAWPWLAHDDPAIRYAARIAIEHQPIGSWKTRALAEEDPIASITALMALTRFAIVRETDRYGRPKCVLRGDESLIQPTFNKLVEFPVEELSLSEMQSLLYLQCTWVRAVPAIGDEFRSQMLHQWDAHFPLRSAEVGHFSPLGSDLDCNRQLSWLLVQIRAEQIVERCVAELERSESQTDQLHYLRLLADVTDGWSPDLRHRYFSILARADRFSGGKGMPGFLEQIRESALAKLSEEELNRAKPLLELNTQVEGPLVIDRPFVRKWTLEAVMEALSDAQHTPSVERGARLFGEIHCIRCHRVGARGPTVGPDLTSVGRRFSRRDLLASILTPSQVVAENYRNIQIVTTDGRVVVGRPTGGGDFRSPNLRIAVDPLRPAKVVELSKEEIDELRISDTSPMPDGLLDTLSAEEIHDLAAYLLNENQMPDDQRTIPDAP
mgnify:FL=1